MGIIEGGYGDRPLPGPWSRRKESAPGPASAGAPGQGETEYSGRGEAEDHPLRGPWDRRGPDPDPLESGPVEVSQPAEARDQAAREEAPACPGDGKAGGPETGESLPRVLYARAAGPAPVVDQAPGHCPAPEPERRGGRTFAHRILSPRGLYAGVIMAEVLGSRGGRYGRR